MRLLIHHARREFLDLRFARFIVFGCVTATVNLAIGGFLYSNDAMVALLPYWAAVVIAGFFAILAGFLLNYFLNFDYRGRRATAMFGTYVLVALSGLAITTALAETGLAVLRLLFDGEGFSLGPLAVSFKFAGHFLAIGSVALYSFLMHKYVTFSVGFRGRLDGLRSRRENGETP